MLLKGGPAGSGTKRAKGEKPREWTHGCTDPLVRYRPVTLAAHWARCPDCGTKRP